MLKEEDVKRLMEPIAHDLTTFIYKAWSKIHASDLNFNSRSRASLMWDEILAQAKVTWADLDRIANIEEKPSQTAHYWLNENTFFRVKKADEKGYTSNYPTQTALEYHSPQSELFDRANKLEVTYVLTPDETEISDINVVQRVGKKIDFIFSLREEVVVEKLPASQDQPSENQKTRTRLNPELEKQLKKAAKNDDYGNIKS